jgi:hypothetical protein
MVHKWQYDYGKPGKMLSYQRMGQSDETDWPKPFNITNPARQRPGKMACLLAYQELAAKRLKLNRQLQVPLENKTGKNKRKDKRK